MLHRYEDKFPVVSRESFVAQSADIIGDVKIAEDASVWYGAVLRGDLNYINVGRGTNIQDNCVLHANPGENPVCIGEYVTVGHNAVLHGCTLGNRVLIGMGSIIMDGAEVGEGTIIGAGSLVTPGKKIPGGVLAVGSPAKVIRALTNEEKESIFESAEEYITISKSYIKE